MANNRIIENLANPHELERMFRTEPDTFRRAFLSAWEQKPDSSILAAWYERLYFKESPNSEKATWRRKDFLSMGILAILAGIVTRILFHYVEQEAIAPVNLAFGILPFLAAYFVYNNPPKKNVIFTLAGLFLFSVFYLNMLPLELTDSTILAYIHLPIFLWV